MLMGTYSPVFIIVSISLHPLWMEIIFSSSSKGIPFFEHLVVLEGPKTSQLTVRISSGSVSISVIRDEIK